MNNIENLGIYDLRNYARNIGVSSPTTKKREVLICEIYGILSGKNKINKNNNRGRKTKDIALKINENLPFINSKKEIVSEIKEILRLNNELIERIQKIQNELLEK